METMDLGQFVATVLKQIARGVSDAGAPVAELDGEVNPQPHSIRAMENRGAMTTYNSVIQNVDFDVAITTVEQSGQEAGLRVVSLFDAKAQGSDLDQVVSRIRFVVPLKLPRAAKTPSNGE